MSSGRKRRIKIRMITPEDLYKYRPFAIYLTKNEDDAMDLLHDVFIKLHACTYEEQGKAPAMIKTVIVNRFIDMYRRKKKYGIYVSLDLVSLSCSQNDFEKEDLSDRQRAIIARYLYNLNPRDKKIWELYMDGFSQKQMAALMNWDMNGISAVCHRIKQKLLKTING